MKVYGGGRRIYGGVGRNSPSLSRPILTQPRVDKVLHLGTFSLHPINSNGHLIIDVKRQKNP